MQFIKDGDHLSQLNIPNPISGQSWGHQVGTSDFLIEAQRSANVRELNAKLTHINTDMETGKNFSDELNRLHKTTQAQFWWATSIEEMKNKTT
ncbi:unnamed protein product [Lupinus luteus]|uniref:Uncharacterized protein n=1 Tax=Lupinus luteus TaxID=3873 RepID=A0AAV1XE71_LUPLU